MMAAANPAMMASHAPLEVALSVIIAISASYAALDLAGRVRVSGGGRRLAWIASGAIAMGNTTTVEKIPVGTLVVDMYDCSSENLIWRGEAQDQLSDKPDKDTKKLDKAVAKMFAKFPPQSM